MAGTIHWNINENIKELQLLSKEYEKKVPFEQFYDKSYKKVIINIDNKIKSILEDVINNYLDLDVAFVQIHKLIIYATDKIDGLFSNSKVNDNHIITYYQFLINFIIFGCCLGAKYTKYISFMNEKHVDFEKSEILKFCINEFIPKVSRKHIKYKQCNKSRESVINSLNEYIKIKDVTDLIADFVEFRFDEFFVTLSVFYKDYDKSQVRHLWKWYGFEPYINFIPKLLLTKKFILINDNEKLQGNLEYFAHTVFEKSMSIKNVRKSQQIGFWSDFYYLALNGYCYAIWVFLLLCLLGFFIHFAVNIDVH